MKLNALFEILDTLEHTEGTVGNLPDVPVLT
jgi:hypothetical protein